MTKNYQPRGLTQTVVTTSYLWHPTSGDLSLIQQNNTYEPLSQKFVGSIAVIRNGTDITIQAQNAILAIRVLLTTATAQAYFANVTPRYWSNGITDWKATYQQQLSFAQSQNWI